MYDCNFGVDVEGWPGAICVDPLLSKRICSTGQSGGEDLVMEFCINFKIPAVLVT